MVRGGGPAWAVHHPPRPPSMPAFLCPLRVSASAHGRLRSRDQPPAARPVPMGPGQARAALGTDGLVWKRSSSALPSPRTLAVPAPSPELSPSPALLKAALELCPNPCFPETAPLWRGGGVIVSVGQREGHLTGLLLSSGPQRPSREPARLSPRAQQLAGLVGHVPSGVPWDHLSQASAGFKGLWVLYSRRAGVSRACVLCVLQDLSTSREEQGPCQPLLAHSYRGSGMGGPLLPSPPDPLQGPCWQGLPSAGGEAGCVQEGCTSTPPPPHQVGWALEAGADPPSRVIGQDGPVMCPGFPASLAKQSRSSDPVPQCGVPPRKEHPSGWQKGPGRPVLFPPPRVWILSSRGPCFLAVFSLRFEQ